MGPFSHLPHNKMFHKMHDWAAVGGPLVAGGRFIEKWVTYPPPAMVHTATELHKFTFEAERDSESLSGSQSVRRPTGSLDEEGYFPGRTRGNTLL